MKDELPPMQGLRVCGYCGSTIQIDGEVLHLPDCNAPNPAGDFEDTGDFGEAP